jgi:hypothetical protein
VARNDGGGAGERCGTMTEGQGGEKSMKDDSHNELPVPAVVENPGFLPVPVIILSEGCSRNNRLNWGEVTRNRLF